MIELGSVIPRLEIFNRFGRIQLVNEPDSRLVLDWVQQLDGHRVVELVVGAPLGWLTVSELGEDVCIGICDLSLESCTCRIVSRQDAAHLLMQALQYQGLPS